jgi:hypothetical protein
VFRLASADATGCEAQRGIGPCVVGDFSLMEAERGRGGNEAQLYTAVTLVVVDLIVDVEQIISTLAGVIALQDAK